MFQSAHEQSKMVLNSAIDEKHKFEKALVKSQTDAEDARDKIITILVT